MIKIAITGNIASGKSTVENILKNLGFKVFDSDVMAHALLNENKTLILNEFNGLDILENNEISRTKLAKFIFTEKTLKEKLENILHPKIRQKVENIFNENSTERAVFISIPLLFETNMQNMFDKVILIYAEDKLRLSRLMKRSALSKQDAVLRLEAQLPQHSKIELSDYTILNNSDETELSIKVLEMLNKFNIGT